MKNYSASSLRWKWVIGNCTQIFPIGVDCIILSWQGQQFLLPCRGDVPDLYSSIIAYRSEMFTTPIKRRYRWLYTVRAVSNLINAARMTNQCQQFIACLSIKYLCPTSTTCADQALSICTVMDRIRSCSQTKEQLSRICIPNAWTAIWTLIRNQARTIRVERRGNIGIKTSTQYL